MTRFITSIAVQPVAEAVLDAPVGPLALSTPYQIPLAIVIGWIGLTLER
jgi:hypothetical protein